MAKCRSNLQDELVASASVAAATLGSSAKTADWSDISSAFPPICLSVFSTVGSKVGATLVVGTFDTVGTVDSEGASLGDSDGDRDGCDEGDADIEGASLGLKLGA